MKPKLLTILIGGLLLTGCSSAPAQSTAPANDTEDTSSDVKTTSDTEKPKNAENTSSEDVASETKTAKHTVYQIGETAQSGDVTITVNSAVDTDEADPTFNTADRLEEGKVYEVIDITLENLGDEEVRISSMMDFDLRDADGRDCEYEITFSDNGNMDGEILPGDKMSGEITFSVPKEGELFLRFDSRTEDSKSVKIQVR